MPALEHHHDARESVFSSESQLTVAEESGRESVFSDQSEMVADDTSKTQIAPPHISEGHDEDAEAAFPALDFKPNFTTSSGFPSLVQTPRSGGNERSMKSQFKRMSTGPLARMMSSDNLGGEIHLFPVMDPESRFRLVWDAVIIANTILAGIIMPLMLVYFDHDAPPRGLNELLVFGIDLLWPIDIILNFRTGFLLKGESMQQPGAIAAHYARGWLLPDLLTACPLALMHGGSTVYFVASILKLTRLLQLQKRFMRLRSGVGGHALLPICILILSTLSVHLMSCAWRTSLRADEGSSPMDSQGDAFEKYVSDVYFVTMTLTSVGYGDVVAIGSISRLFSILLMLVGSAVFGALITASSFIFKKIVHNETEHRITELVRFMKKRTVPKELQRRVKANLRRHLDYEDNVTMAPHLLASLSPSMQRELCLSMLSATVLRFPLFRNCQESFAAELSLAIYFEQVLPTDIVTPEGHAVQELIFLMEGCMQGWLADGCGKDVELDAHISQVSQDKPDGPDEFYASAHSAETNTERRKGDKMIHVSSQLDEDFIEIHAGTWFGEASLFDEERVYTAVIAALTKCELAVLPGHEYRKVVSHFPRLLDRHNGIKAGIAAGQVSLSALKCKDLDCRTATSKNVKVELLSRFTFFKDLFKPPQSAAVSPNFQGVAESG